MLSNLVCGLLQFDILFLFLFLALVEETIAFILSKILRGVSYYSQPVADALLTSSTVCS